VLSDEIIKLIKRDCVPGGTRENLYATTVTVDWQAAGADQQLLLTDAQTSGGLLLCVAEKKLAKVLNVLHKARTPCAAVIGKIVARRRGTLICMTK
jgi:selenide,water dikinase